VQKLIKEMNLKELLKDNTSNIDGVIKALKGKKFDSSTNVL
jgi:hypothetical protein